MLVSSAYELKDKNRIELLRKYLDRYPDTPYANLSPTTLPKFMHSFKTTIRHRL